MSSSKGRISFCPSIESRPDVVQDDVFQALLDEEHSLVEELHSKLERLRADRIALEATVEQESSQLVSKLKAQLRALLSSSSSTPSTSSLPFQNHSNNSNPTNQPSQLPSPSPSDFTPATPQTPFFEPGSPNNTNNTHSSFDFRMRRSSIESLHSLQSENRDLRNKLDEYVSIARDSERWRLELIELRERCGIGTDDLQSSSQSQSLSRFTDPTPGLALRYPHPQTSRSSLQNYNYNSNVPSYVVSNGVRSSRSFSITSQASQMSFQSRLPSCTSTSSHKRTNNSSTSPSPKLPSFSSLSTSPMSPISPAEGSFIPSAARTTLTTPSTSYVPTLVPPSSPQTNSPNAMMVTLLPLTSAQGGNTRVASAVSISGISRQAPRRPSASMFNAPTTRTIVNWRSQGSMQRSRRSSQSRPPPPPTTAVTVADPLSSNNMPLFLSDEDLSDGYGEVMKRVEEDGSGRGTPLISGGVEGRGRDGTTTSRTSSRKSSGKASWATIDDDEDAEDDIVFD